MSDERGRIVAVDHDAEQTLREHDDAWQGEPDYFDDEPSIEHTDRLDLEHEQDARAGLI